MYVEENPSSGLLPKIPVLKDIKRKRNLFYTRDFVDIILTKLLSSDFKILKEPKVEAEAHGKKLLALNEIQIHNMKPWKALRFNVKAGEKIFTNVIGDGILVSTPFGSTAYYNVLGHRPFEDGLRLVGNNTKPRINPIPVHTAEVIILREEAYLIADNNENFIKLKPGDTVKINLSKETARFVRITLEEYAEPIEKPKERPKRTAKVRIKKSKTSKESKPEETLKERLEKISAERKGIQGLKTQERTEIPVKKQKPKQPKEREKAPKEVVGIKKLEKKTREKSKSSRLVRYRPP